MKTKLFFALCSLGLFGWLVHEQRPVTVKVGGLSANYFEIIMPLKDRKRLEYFLSRNLSGGGIYTLMGSKPMSLVDGYHNLSRDRVSWSFKNIKMILASNAWDKYRHYFKDSRFTMLKLTEYKANQFILIDKVMLEETIRQNVQDFENILQIPIDPKALVEEIQNKPQTLYPILNHDGLLGTVLGFGRDNAWAFYEREREEQGPRHLSGA